MLLFGVIVMLASTGGGAYLCWENRHARVHLEAAGHVWTGHLYGVLLGGAILAGWTMLGLSCVALWVRERRERKAALLPAEAQETRLRMMTMILLTMALNSPINMECGMLT